MKTFLSIEDRVGEALSKKRPVVALESTLFLHGLPYPESIHLYEELEDMALSQGVVPAVIAILHGRIQVGLKKEDLDRISSAEGVPKASLLDLPIFLSQGLDGATTVASTMQIAELAGIKTFVTGGIGGVHRGVEKTFDISADLLALSRYPVVVISSGVKSILDIPKTKELLETLGIPTLGYRAYEFPAFYLRESGLFVDYKVNRLEEVVAIYHMRRELGPGGVLLTNPVSRDQEIDPLLYHEILDSLLEEVEQMGMKGKLVTPYLLKRLKEKTHGATLETNLALIKENMELGIELAPLLVGDGA